MLDQGEITRVDNVLLSFLSTIKGDFLGVGDDARVSKAEFSLYGGEEKNKKWQSGGAKEEKGGGGEKPQVWPQQHATFQMVE